MNKYIERHCKRMHPITEQLWERMYIVLQTAMLGVDVNDIVLPEAHYNGEPTTEVENQNITQIIHSMPINVNDTTIGLSYLTCYSTINFQPSRKSHSQSETWVAVPRGCTKH
jgi:hypothetical protein